MISCVHNFFEISAFKELLTNADDTVLKSYIFRSAWPTSVAAIDLTSDAADAIEEFEVTWRYQHFEASGVNF